MTYNCIIIYIIIQLYVITSYYIVFNISNNSIDIYFIYIYICIYNTY